MTPPASSDVDGRAEPRLAAAVEIARAAAETDAATVPGGAVGDHAGAQPEDDGAVTHLFEATYPGYRGWRWAVTVCAAGPDEPVTVSEVVLLPGPQALVAPEWVPWDQRVRAGDLGVGDLLPPSPDDPRLVPGYVQSDDPAVEEVARETGLGRVRVLSLDGRLDAARRWHDERGPRAEMAVSAPASCGTCGFYLPLAGSLRAAFGVCGNEYAPADGRAVHVEFGCGAHSEVEVDTSPSTPVAEVVYDDAQLDVVTLPAQPPAAPAADAPGTADAAPATDVPEATDAARATDTAAATEDPGADAPTGSTASTDADASRPEA